MQSKSALRCRRVNNFIVLWCIAAYRGLYICVSSTSFQKNDIGWPQQPQTERLLKFNMIFHDSTPQNFFSKHKEFKCLDEFEVLSSDFSGLKTSATSLTSSASAASMASTASKALFHQRTSWFWWFDHPWHQNDQQLSVFIEFIIKNPIFLLILAPFLREAVEANRCYFFLNGVKKLKCPPLLKPLGTIFQHNYWSFYTSEPFTLGHFNVRYPVGDAADKISFDQKEERMTTVNLRLILKLVLVYNSPKIFY